MIVNTGNPWESSDKADLVSIGSHALFVSTNGPPRRAKAPVVIFVTGGGAPTELYAHLHSALSRSARNYFYDRAGYGRSERPRADNHIDQVTAEVNRPPMPDESHAHSESAFKALSLIDSGFASRFYDQRKEAHNCKIRAEDTAAELHKLMAAIHVKPPYVLAAHSYGGIIARTYFALFPEDIAGIALLDTNSELLQQCLSPIPATAFMQVTKHIDVIALWHLREKSRMTDKEWDATMSAIQRTMPASADEATHASGRQLARFMQIDRRAMADRPLLVTGSEMVKDWRKLLEEALRLGYGTHEQRAQAEWWMESAELFWLQAQQVQLRLSSDAEWYFFDGEGHHFPTTLPEKTASLIRRLLDRAEQWVFHIERKEQSSGLNSGWR